jgi:hypothetical protein
VGRKASPATGENKGKGDARGRAPPRLKSAVGVVLASEKVICDNTDLTKSPDGVPKFIGVERKNDKNINGTHNELVEEESKGVTSDGDSFHKGENGDKGDEVVANNNGKNNEGEGELFDTKIPGDGWRPEEHKEMVAASDVQRKAMIKSFVKTTLFKTTKFLVHEKQMEWDSEILAVPILNELGVEGEERRKQMWAEYKLDAKRALHERRATVNGSIKVAVIGKPLRYCNILDEFVGKLT